MKKAVPRFKTEDEERDYWASHDSTEHVDWSSARRVLLPNLKPSLKTISVRLPQCVKSSLAGRRRQAVLVIAERDKRKRLFVLKGR